MKLVTIVLGLAAIATAAPSKKGKLIWEDNFDTLDHGKWKHTVSAWSGGNQEFVYYRNVRKNSWVTDGMLHIKPTPTSDEKTDNEIRHGTIYDPTCNLEPCVSQSGPDSVAPMFSARMHTQGTFDFTYGRVEVSARIPRGDWIWPAIWMMPAQDWYGQWPRSGEIDIMEARGNKDLRDPNGPQQGVGSISSTMHWGPDENNNRFYLTHWERVANDFSNGFHSYEVEWSPDHITFSVNGNEIGSVKPPIGGFWKLGGFNGASMWDTKMGPFDKPFHIILNVAVGGRFFADSNVNYGSDPRPWHWNSGHPMLQFYEAEKTVMKTWDRPAMQVDYVRVYAL